MDIGSSSSLMRKIFEYKILSNPKLQETENAHNNIAIKHTLQYSHNNSTRSPMPESSISKEKEIIRKLTVIKQEVSNGNT
jgi:hypothetical protein